MSVNIPLGAFSDETFRKIGEISGENVFACIQCGTCSAVCPMADSMQLTTRSVMLLLQHGQAQSILDANSPHVCAACHTCEVRCPRGIHIPRVMEALRQVLLRQNEDFINPRELPPEKIADVPQIALVAAFRKLTA